MQFHNYQLLSIIVITTLSAYTEVFQIVHIVYLLPWLQLKACLHASLHGIALRLTYVYKLSMHAHTHHTPHTTHTHMHRYLETPCSSENPTPTLTMEAVHWHYRKLQLVHMQVNLLTVTE